MQYSLSFDQAQKSDIRILLDGKETHITMYEAVYAGHPTQVAMVPDDAPDQRLSLYVPDHADSHSPMIFFVKNWGWKVNAYQLRHQVEDGKAYASNADNDLIGKLMAEGYVLVTYGCRSRGDRPTAEGKYISHAPATVTDTKAVIRYLRYNRDLLPAGDPERIVITGTSGGGALSTIIGASGNHADFFPSLYEIGAAGIEKEGNAYCSTIRDDVYAVIAYCPINDLREGDAAYEYTYGETRRRLVREGLPAVDDRTGLTFQDPFTESYTPEFMLEASEALGRQYGRYVNSLQLKDESGVLITGDGLREKIRVLLNAGFRKAFEKVGGERMREDLAGNAEYSGQHTACMYNSKSPDWDDPFSRDADGAPCLADEAAVQRYLYFVARNQPLKVVCAFSNLGLGERGLASVSGFHEDTLYGTTDQAYCPFEFWSWNHNRQEGTGVGRNNTRLDFEEYLKTDAGQLLQLQLNTTTPIHYLTGECENEPDICAHWYVRHGLRDRDTSFALQTVLYQALRNNRKIRNLNFALTWLQPHSGDYDVQEAYTWLKSIEAPIISKNISKE